MNHLFFENIFQKYLRVEDEHEQEKQEILKNLEAEKLEKRTLESKIKSLTDHGMFEGTISCQKQLRFLFIVAAVEKVKSKVDRELPTFARLQSALGNFNDRMFGGKLTAYLYLYV